MVRDLGYYVEEFGFIPNGISLNILGQRRETDSSFRETVLVTST